MSFFEQALFGHTDDAAEEAETDLFSHSHSFLAIATESQRNQIKHPLPSRSPVREQERKHVKAEHTPKVGRAPLKRRRITREDGAALLEEVGLSPVIKSTADVRPRRERSCSDNAQETPVHSTVPKAQLAIPLSPQPSPSDDDNNDDDDEEVEIVSWKTAPPAPPPIEQKEQEEEDSDPEFAALQRKARERHKERLGSANSPSPGPVAGVDTEPPDPPISILITSQIPNTNPLIVRRRLSQRLQEVREAWCAKQGFSPDYTAQVFLTHCGLKKYNVTTCRSLGLDADASGRVFLRHDPSRENVEKVHLEAMTEELFQRARAERIRQQRIEEEGGQAAEGDAAFDGAADDGGPAGEERASEAMIRLTIQTKDRKEFRVQVHAHATFAKIMRAAKKSFGLPAEQAVYLEFDGERLEPDDTVGDSEVEDLNCLDLYCGT